MTNVSICVGITNGRVVKTKVGRCIFRQEADIFVNPFEMVVDLLIDSRHSCTTHSPTWDSNDNISSLGALPSTKSGPPAALSHGRSGRAKSKG